MVTVHRLLLSVQRLLQHQLGESVAIPLGLHVQGEVAVGGDLVVAQGVGTHVWVECALQGEAGARRGALRDLYGQVRLREGGGIVVDVQHLDLHPKQLQGVLQEDLQVQDAGGALLADLLAVNLLIHVQHPGLQVEVQVRGPRVGSRLKAASRKFCNVQAQIFSDIPHESAMFLLLLHRVVKLGKDSFHHPEQGKE
uniref:Uncharacterized protein n=1 Tax=Bos indicus x Bos taurus TaxID=30522 RepID=A0A4W2HCW4_BOBOX